MKQNYVLPLLPYGEVVSQSKRIKDVARLHVSSMPEHATCLAWFEIQAVVYRGYMQYPQSRLRKAR